MYEYRARLQHVHDQGEVSLVVDLGFRIQAEIRVQLYGVKVPSTASADVDERDCAVRAAHRITELCQEQLRIRVHHTAGNRLFTADVFYIDPDTGRSVTVSDALVKAKLAEPVT